MPWCASFLSSFLPSLLQFLVFLTLLDIPQRKLAVAFRLLDTDGSGAISRQEFDTLLQNLQRKSSGHPLPPAALRTRQGDHG